MAAPSHELCQGALVMVVNPSVPARTVPEFMLAFQSMTGSSASMYAMGDRDVPLGSSTAGYIPRAISAQCNTVPLLSGPDQRRRASARLH
jgi:hypothetical protein